VARQPAEGSLGAAPPELTSLPELQGLPLSYPTAGNSGGYRDKTFCHDQ
jgi:hypothetical protein